MAYFVSASDILQSEVLLLFKNCCYTLLLLEINEAAPKQIPKDC